MLVYWPGLTADIEQYVRSCQTCARNMPSNQKEPMISHEIPCLPWQKVTSDLLTLNNNDYLVTVDYHSHFFRSRQTQLHYVKGRHLQTQISFRQIWHPIYTNI